MSQHLSVLLVLVRPHLFVLLVLGEFPPKEHVSSLLDGTWLMCLPAAAEISLYAIRVISGKYMVCY